MFSRYESYKLFPLLFITSVYNIWNNIFFLSLFLRWGATFHAGVIGGATWWSFKQRHCDEPLLTLLMSLWEGNVFFKQFVWKCVESGDAKTGGPCYPVAVSLVSHPPKRRRVTYASTIRPASASTLSTFSMKPLHGIISYCTCILV